MWANHNTNHLWDKRNSDDFLDTVIWSGVVTPEIFDKICDRTIEKYFKKENYYCIDGCPVYMIFDIDNFIRSFGTSDECKKAIEEFNRKTVEAGFKGLHLQFIHWRDRVFNWLRDDDSQKGVKSSQMYDYLGASSVTSYNWGCSTDFDGEFTEVTDNYINAIEGECENLNIPFYPNISVGWDNNVRFNEFVPGVVVNNTPENFRTACEKIKAFADKSTENKIMKAPFITVNSWNEWTETSYLEHASVDRIDKNGHYELSNMQVIPLDENIRKDKVKAQNDHCECYVCKTTKPLEEFSVDNRRKNGRSTICKACENIRGKEKYLRLKKKK